MIYESMAYLSTLNLFKKKKYFSSYIIPVFLFALVISCGGGGGSDSAAADPGADKILTVGPGGEFSSIQAAIDFAQDGYTIEILPGTYNESIVVNRRVSITGAGAGTIITGGSGSPGGSIFMDSFEKAAGSPGIIQIAVSGSSDDSPLIIRGILVKSGGRPGFTVSGNISFIKLDTVQVTGSGGTATDTEYGLYVDDSSSLGNFTVINSSFNNLDYGIFAKNLGEATFENVDADSNDKSGIDITLVSGDVRFRNCDVTNTSGGAGLSIKASTGDITVDGGNYTGNKQGIVVDNIGAEDPDSVNITNANIFGSTGGDDVVNNSSAGIVANGNFWGENEDPEDHIGGTGAGVTVAQWYNSENKTDDTKIDNIVKPGESIQAAIDAAGEGDVIKLVSGTYDEVIDIKKRITLLGDGSGDTGGTVLTRTTVTNPAPYPAQVDGVTYSYNPVVIISASGISGNPLLLKNIKIRPRQDLIGAARQVPAILFHPGTAPDYNASYSYVQLNNVRAIGTSSAGTPESGVRIDGNTSLDHFTVNNSEFSNMAYGMIFHNSYNAANQSTVHHVVINGTIFNNNSIKGFYAEKLSDAAFNNVSATNNGNTARSPVWADANNAGIDINLKYGPYRNLVFNNLTVTGNGLTGDPAINPNYGAGLAVKARGTGNDPDTPSDPKHSHPASLDTVAINGGTYSGNQVGILLGEPGKNNTSPAGISINAVITGNTFDLSNELSPDAAVLINNIPQNTFTTVLRPSVLVMPAAFQTFGYGWDWDMEHPEGTTDAGGAPDANYNFGNSAFFSDVSGISPRKYTALRIYPQAVFNMTDVTVGDIMNISYRTKQKVGDGSLDSSPSDRSWQLKIFTVNPEATAAMWYKTRLNSRIPYYADIAWKENSTDGNLDFNKIVRKNPDGTENDLALTETLNQVRADTANNFGSESILWIDIITGDNTSPLIIQSYLDGIVIELTNGRIAVIDLEAD